MADKIKIAVAVALLVGGNRGVLLLVTERDDHPRSRGDRRRIGWRGGRSGPRRQARNFYAYARESIEEAKRVVWPTRKETLQTTGVVFAFVFVMAVFLWLVDAGLLWAVRLLMGRSDS